jgi:PleD family two-component response regulator
MEILEQIKDSIENSSVLTSNSQNISYTISVGLLHTPADTLQDSLDEADMLLFKAKEQGRNCIVSA